MTLDEMTAALNEARGGKFGTDYAGTFDISEAEATRIAAASSSAAEFESTWETQDWWTDENAAATRKTIDLHMTWTAAAQIIAAALEAGTDKGKEAARAELMRMASILDAGQPNPTLFEVVASNDKRPAYGVAFASEADANAYASKLQALGYSVEAYPPHEATSLEDGLSDAALWFTDTRITAEPTT